MKTSAFFTEGGTSMHTVDLGQSPQGDWSFATTKRTIFALLALSLLFAHFPVSESQAAKCAAPSSTKSKCLSAKYKTARDLVSGTLKCDATALREGVAIDPDCDQKTTSKFDAKWNKAEEKGDCLTTGDEDAVVCIGQRLGKGGISAVLAGPAALARVARGAVGPGRPGRPPLIHFSRQAGSGHRHGDRERRHASNHRGLEPATAH